MPKSVIPECFAEHAKNWKAKALKRAKPLTEIVSKEILQLDGTYNKHDFRVTYHFTPESEGYSADIHILKIEYYQKFKRGFLITEIKVNKKYFEEQLLDLHLNHR